MPLFQIQHRHDTTENWEGCNPVLLEGEMGLEYKADGSQAFKLGDGVTAWIDLPYASGPKGDTGEKGDDGPIGATPDHEWDGTALRFKRADGSWGQAVDLKGPKGDSGDEPIAPATTTSLGLVKIGKNLTIRADGTLDANSGVPIGSLKEFAHNNIEEGYLVCNGAAVGRATYPLLFAKLGTIWGAGDGSTTFNLPDYRGKFLEGGAVAGQYKEAGLPNITGYTDNFSASYKHYTKDSGAIITSDAADIPNEMFARQSDAGWDLKGIRIDASRSNPIYGKSNTVQPASATVVICIKAFDAVVETGDVTTEHLANDVAVLSANVATKTTMAQAANAGMPSGRRINFSLSTLNGTTLATAPGDGYMVLLGSNEAQAHGIINENNTSFVRASDVSERAWGCCAVIPCRTGDSISLVMWNCTYGEAFFVYAEGAN